MKAGIAGGERCAGVFVCASVIGTCVDRHTHESNIKTMTLTV